MALIKVNYVDGTTVIHANNLNAIQDEIISNAADIADNRTDIDSQAISIAANTAAIADNTEDIADNTAAIATKENIGKITIGGTEYEAVISNVDAGQAGKIVFYIEE